eukprot:scaffold135138_cov19-Tisochrysis_lutea.AAC.2
MLLGLVLVDIARAEEHEPSSYMRPPPHCRHCHWHEEGEPSSYIRPPPHCHHCYWHSGATR